MTTKYSKLFALIFVTFCLAFYYCYYLGSSDSYFKEVEVSSLTLMSNNRVVYIAVDIIEDVYRIRGWTHLKSTVVGWGMSDESLSAISVYVIRVDCQSVTALAVPRSVARSVIPLDDNLYLYRKGDGDIYRFDCGEAVIISQDEASRVRRRFSNPLEKHCKAHGWDYYNEFLHDSDPKKNPPHEFSLNGKKIEIKLSFAYTTVGKRSRPQTLDLKINGPEGRLFSKTFEYIYWKQVTKDEWNEVVDTPGVLRLK